MNNDLSKKNIVRLLKFFIEKIESNELDFETVKDIDYYWDIVDPDILYNPEASTEEELSLGQISDEWGTLMEILNTDQQEIIGYNFKCLSSIIRLLGQVYTKTLIENKDK